MANNIYNNKCESHSITYSEVKSVLRGDIWMADLGEARGNIQGGIRPVIIVQNNTGNLHSSVTIVVPVTSQQKNHIPTHINIGRECGLAKDSTALAEQITPLNKSSLIKRIGKLDEKATNLLRQATIISCVI